MKTFNPKEWVRKARLQKKRAVIITLTFNRWILTEQCLESIFKNTFMPYNLIVVDNGSWDGTVEKLKNLIRTNKIFRLLLLGKNVGVSRGANYGLKASSTGNYQWLARVDNDIQVSPYWLAYTSYISNLLGFGIIGVNVEGYKTKVKKFKVVNGVQLDVGYNPGGIYVMSKKTFIKLGYFQEGSLYGLEDVEIHARQRFHNLRSVYVHRLGKQYHKCRTLPDIDFKLKHGTYEQWKTHQHDKVMLPKWLKGKYPILKHYETDITLQQVEKCTYEMD